MRKKGFYIFFTFSLMSFLFLSSFVNADTTISIDSNFKSFYESHIDSMIPIAESYFQSLKASDSAYDSYIIQTNPTNSSGRKIWVYYLKPRSNSSFAFSYNSPNFVSTYYNGKQCRYNESDYSLIQCLDLSASTLSLTPVVTYSSRNFLWQNCNSAPFIFVSGDDSYTDICSTDSNVPTLDFLIDYWSTPPPDDYPLLTSFFSLVIDKLATICDYITSSYVCLSVIVILILYICILIFRRLT